MKKIIVIIMMLLFLASQSVYAFQPIVIGGIRDGLAIGVIAEKPIANKIKIRFGIEANTGNQPVMLLFGGRMHLFNIERRYPFSLGLGIVTYFGDKASIGGSVSCVVSRIFDVNRLFVEAGIDITDSTKFQLQIGYSLPEAKTPSSGLCKKSKKTKNR